MGKLGMIGRLGSARRSLPLVWAWGREARAAARRSNSGLGCVEAPKIRPSERRSPCWVGLALALGLASTGCRCEPEPPAEVSSEDCFQVCASSAGCPANDQRECAARCRRLAEQGRVSRANLEVQRLLGCAREHACSNVFGEQPSACGSELRALERRLASCQPGSVRSRGVDGGSLVAESLGCLELRDCTPTRDAGALGGPCEAPSTCNAVCCSACGGERTLRVQACVHGRCASEQSACSMLADSERCRE